MIIILVDMVINDIGGYEMITMVTNDTLLSPLKIF